jgi:hypothetical protein
MEWTGLVSLKIGTSEFGDEPSEFHKMLGNCRVASQLVASQVVLSSIKIVYYPLM